MQAALITGSRSWNNGERIKLVVRDCELIVVGCAKGADLIARKVSMGAGCMPPKVFEAAWRRPDGSKDKAAGFVRNQAMVDFCVDLRADGILVHCHAFWDGRSHGTQDCFERASRAGLSVIVHRL